MPSQLDPNSLPADLGPAILLGIAVTGFVLAALSGKGKTGEGAKGAGLGAVAVGMLTTMYLLRRPEALDAAMERIGERGIAIVLAALLAALLFWKVKSWFSK